MKYTICILIWCIVCITLDSQAQDVEKIILKPNWQKGEIKKITTIKSNVVVSRQSQEQFIDTTFIYQITVLNKTDDGYSLEWKILNVNDIANTKYEKKYLSKFKYLVILDTLGNFKEIKNWESLLALNKAIRQKNKKNKELTFSLDLKGLALIGEIATMQSAETKDDIIAKYKELTNPVLGLYGKELVLNNRTIESKTVSLSSVSAEEVPIIIETIIQNIDRITKANVSIYSMEGINSLEKRKISESEFAFNRTTNWMEKSLSYSESDNNSFVIKEMTEYIIE